MVIYNPPGKAKYFNLLVNICQDFWKNFKRPANRTFGTVLPENKCFIAGCTLFSSEYGIM